MKTDKLELLLKAGDPVLAWRAAMMSSLQMTDLSGANMVLAQLFSLRLSSVTAEEMRFLMERTGVFSPEVVAIIIQVFDRGNLNLVIPEIFLELCSLDLQEIMQLVEPD